jgi:hypothetical protein
MGLRPEIYFSQFWGKEDVSAVVSGKSFISDL